MIAYLDFQWYTNLCKITKTIHNNNAATLSSAAPHLGMVDALHERNAAICNACTVCQEPESA
jgi:hypothetical protein